MGVVVSFVKILPKRRFIRTLFYLGNLNLNKFFHLNYSYLSEQNVRLGEDNGNDQTKGLRQAPSPRVLQAVYKPMLML